MQLRGGLDLTEEEERSLSLDLFREWWMISIQALSDKAGQNRAIQLLNPYLINSGMALSLNIPQILNIQNRTVETDALTLAAIHHCSFKTTFERLGIGTSEIKAKSHDCWTKGNSFVICNVMCETCPKAYTDSFCPSVDYRMTSSLSWGDQYCSWFFKDRRSVEDEDKTERIIPDILLPDDLKSEMSLHLLGELWTIAIRAYIDYAGSEMAIEKLSSYMRHSGMSIGILLVNQYKVDNDLDSLKNIVKMIERMHHIKGEFTESSLSLECEVNECPFSDGPMELCHQYSSFFNGLLEAVNPEYEFVYNKMMTKGDKVCHWVIDKKCHGKTTREESSNASDTPIDILKKRLARGEISKEEYLELKDLLD